MRAIIMSLILGLASIGVVGLTPTQAQAQARWWGRGRYYAPAYSSYYYNPGYYSPYAYPYSAYYNPGYRSYYYTPPAYNYPSYSYYYTPYNSYYYRPW